MKGKIVKKCIVLTVTLSMLSMGMVANANESYTVQSGDNLSKIANCSYGDSTQWKTIYEANKDSIKKPDLIYKGQVLTIPRIAEADIVTENTNIFSYEEAEAIWDNFWAEDYLSYFDEDVLNYFDEDGDHVLTGIEVRLLRNWVAYENDTNKSNTCVSCLDEQETIALAIHVVNRDIPIPDTFFRVIDLQGRWIGV